MSNEMAVARRLDNPVAVTSGNKAVIDARAYRKIVIRPESGGSIKYSVVNDDTATSHGWPSAPSASSADAVVTIDPVKGLFYLVEAITANCTAHGVP